MCTIHLLDQGAVKLAVVIFLVVVFALLIELQEAVEPHDGAGGTFLD